MEALRFSAGSTGRGLRTLALRDSSTLRAARREAGDMSPMHVDVRNGVRLRIPGMAGALRIDGAHGLSDGANALAFGWQF